ncbi:MAG: hypothetical protein IT436_00115 [Phycisphaerales bacterium]|nr:hypothetical protein [Phycisphaerales bacterium]
MAMLLGPAGGWLVLFGPSVPYVPEWVPEIATIFGAPLVFILGFACRCQRLRPVVLTAGLFGFTYWLSFIITQDLVQRTSAGAQMLSGAWVGFLFAASILAVLAGLFAVLARWLARFLLIIYIEQTGRLCPRCAYTIDPGIQAVCPECGAAAVPDPGPRRPLARARTAIRRFAHATLLIILLVYLAAMVTIIARRGYPIYRFQSSLTNDATARPGGFIAGVKPGGAAIETWAPGVWIPFPGSPSRGVIAAYIPDDRPGLPAMQLRMANRLGPNSFAEATPLVRSSLTRAQAELVIRDGVPASLLQSIEAASGGPPDALPISPGTAIDIDPAPHLTR